MNTEEQISLEPATHEHEATRTLVKSPPELWAECSEAASLARHLGEFGEIKITRLEPETVVAWEGERASGTVRIEPSAWGTRVTLTAQTKSDPASDEPVVGEKNQEAADAAAEVQVSEPMEEDSDAQVEKTLEEPDPGLAAEPGVVGGRRRLIDRIRWLFTAERDREIGPSEPMADEDPERTARVEPELGSEQDHELAPEPPEPDSEAAVCTESGQDPETILATALDSLGQAHHRPFSRA